ncbi:HNH endonuclease [Williamsia muralis]|uniref:HNH endonuclease n=1 Tax=Williamsia marianensis TaxID=85044 RepID=UPI0039E8C19A
MTAQWRSILDRRVPAAGKRQDDFVPCEVVLCLCASLLVDYNRFGSGSAHRAGFPVQELARLFKRPPTSVIAKMTNLEGTRSRGGKYDRRVSDALLPDQYAMQDVYLKIIRAARSLGVDEAALPDFLELETGDELWLLGQEELDDAELDRSVAPEVERLARNKPELSTQVTQRLLIARARIGQHRFARGVLTNHSNRCVFCGLSGHIGGLRRKRMLTASHIKPWRDSDNKERLDTRNGLTACPTHDVAFDTGLITVDDDLRIQYSSGVEENFASEPPLRAALGKPPLFDKLVLPVSAARPDFAYLDWHRERVFVRL